MLIVVCVATAAQNEMYVHEITSLKEELSQVGSICKFLHMLMPIFQVLIAFSLFEHRLERDVLI